MRMVLFRHGIAGVAASGSDKDRALTPRGVQKTRQAARGLGRVLGHVPPGADPEGRGVTLWTSPLVRAGQTADILRAVLQVEGPAQEVADLSPRGDPRRLLEALRRSGESDTVVLVGHEPSLSLLASLALTGHFEVSIRLGKAGALALDLPADSISARAALQWHFTSDQLAWLGAGAAKR